MQYSHGRNDDRSITRWSMVVFLLLLSSAASALAQGPSYLFATQVPAVGSPRASVIDANDNVYVTGSFSGTVDFDPGPGVASFTSTGTWANPYLASYDAAGNYRWAIRLGTGTTQLYDRAASVAIDGNGDIVVTGNFSGTVDFDPGAGTANMTGPAMFVACYSPAGAYRWAFRPGSTSTKGSIGHAGPAGLAIDPSGNIVISGSFHGIVDFDPGSGTATRTSTKSAPGSSIYSSDIFIAKYSSTGGFLWAVTMGSTGGEEAVGAATDAAGNVYITGQFAGTVDFNPAKATANLTSAGGNDIVVGKYSSAGAYLWAFRAGGTGDELGRRIASDANGNTVVTGDFRGTVDFDPGAGTTNLTAVGTTGNVFAARYSTAGALLWAFSPVESGSANVTIGGNGDIYLAGAFRLANDFDPGPGTTSFAAQGGYVACYAPLGNLNWAFPLTGATHQIETRAMVNGAGDVYLTGSLTNPVDFDPSAGTAILTPVNNSDFFIAKYGTPPPAKRSARDAASQSLHAAPNPFTDRITLTWQSDELARVEVVDMMGRMVESLETVGSVTLGAELPAGMYVVRVVEGDVVRQTVVRKVR